ncbi:MAG: L,D-transpeptidase family protein, partial [Prosthecobacter sp.]
IYIHGTPEENRLGTPASYGCIRMGMKDVVEAFNDIGIGAKVVVTRGSLPLGKKADVPQPTPEAEVVIAEKKSDAEVPVAIPVTLNKADTAAAQVKTKKKVGPEAPDAKPSEKSNADAKPIAKSKKTAGKPEKITTNSRHRVAIERAHG